MENVNESIILNNNVICNEECNFNNKCVKCQIYYSLPHKNHCSECESLLPYDNIELTIEEILELPSGALKSLQMNKNLEFIYQLFAKTNNIKNKLVKNINQFKILKNICNNVTAEEVFCILDGNRGFSPCLLPANYADELLEQCFTNNSQFPKHKYIHAIAPFIFDIWNVSNKYSTLNCYYKDIDFPKKCPNDIDKLFKIWRKCIDPPFITDFEDTFLCECPICDNDISLKSQKVKCTICHSYFHLDCIDEKYFYCSNCLEHHDYY